MNYFTVLLKEKLEHLNILEEIDSGSGDVALGYWDKLTQEDDVLRLSLTIPNLVWFAPIFFPAFCSQPRIAVVKVATIMNLCEHV